MSQKLDWALTEIKNGLHDSMPRDRQKAAEIVVEELQSAKAENGRLQDGFVRAVVHFDNGMGALAKMEWVKALSSSNALDWLKGELRKAERKGIQKASDILFALHKYDKASNILILELRKSNPQSKGEKGVS